MAGAIFKDRLRVVGLLATRGATIVWRRLVAPFARCRRTAASAAGTAADRAAGH
ncbi:hypothetical protein RZS28_03390 [Methylocapsa polymorpha]|uniref:Transposase n=1 Tax=Methylocapsa polymorpha TaxID=3080828 RepID=A0ABZ0HSR1_9HYPH|nr:hypothetical protein RZS28_03390 [Methylocapsa sp. RX1]